MKRILIISPHLDDAVLSCGARIRQWIKEGNEVKVVSVFTHTGDAAAEEAQALYNTRRSDDVAALTAMQASFTHLSFADAPFRNPAYHNFHTLLFHEAVPPAEAPVKEAVQQALHQLVQQYAPHTLVLPLGVGAHIDHRIVFEAATVFITQPLEIIFYEELPYALVEGLPALALAHAKAIPIVADEMAYPAASFSPLLSQTVPVLKNYITGAVDAQMSEYLYQEQLSRLNPALLQADRCLVNGTAFEKESYELTPEEDTVKAADITRYSTEWPALLGETAAAGCFEYYWIKK